MLKTIISSADLACSAYPTELRYQQNSVRRYTLTSGHVSANSRQDERGISARCYKDGAYGFASSAEANPDAVRRVLAEAESNAKLLAKYKKQNQGAFPQPAALERSLQISWQDTEQAAYAAYAKLIDDYVVKNCPRIKDRIVSLYADTQEKHIIVDQFCDTHIATPRTYLYLFLMADAHYGGVVEVFDSLGGFGDLEQALPPLPEVYAFIERQYRYLLDKVEAVPSRAGEHSCVISGRLAGMLAHEAVGHTVEADLVLGGSVAAKLLGQQVAAPGVSLVDFAHTALNEPAPLPVYVDDEGVPAQDAVIIENGILRSYLHNRSSAEKLGQKALGNARAWAYYDEPLIRMRNTAILPGQDSLEEMIASTEDGYYLVSTNNGQADNTGEFMFGISMGYEIKNGKLGRAIRDTTVSGVAFDMLKSVDAIADQLEWGSSGFCGKKQRMAVGIGGPALRCRMVIGGQ